jgi:glucose/arabinose dehydrogenase
MKNSWLLGGLIVLVLLALGWYILTTTIGSISIPRSEKVENGNLAEGLQVPAGFMVSVFARGVEGARVMLFDPRGRMLVSQTDKGTITLLSSRDGNQVVEKSILVDSLSHPHGMAFQCQNDTTCYLYVAESDVLTRFTYTVDTGTVSEKTKMVDLPSSVTDRHYTRTLLFLPAPEENRLLISVGSSCNVCSETSMRAKILAYDTETKKLEEYATGLRNSVFMALHPVNGSVWATEMGRDGLGDDVPPDEINIIKRNKNYGWPNCYGKNIHDTEFDKNTYIRNPCMEPFETPSYIDIQAHSAPLGITFIPEEGWGEEYWYNALVAYHGSWNRSVPTGYKIVRMKLDANGKYLGQEDFVTGFLTNDGKKIGRPVDVLALPGGVLYISDDSAGAIYRVTKK